MSVFSFARSSKINVRCISDVILILIFIYTVVRVTLTSNVPIFRDVKRDFYQNKTQLDNKP